MLKKLFAFLLLLAPLAFGSFNGASTQNMLVLQEKSIKRSVESDSFISYWKEEFRKDDNGQIIAICDITFNSYREMYGKYVLLSNEDRKTVNSTPDYEEGYISKNEIKSAIEILHNAGRHISEKLYEQLIIMID